MNDLIRDITHKNVIKLLQALEATNARVDELQKKVFALEQLNKQLSYEVADSKVKANTAMGIALNINGSSTAG